MNSPALFRSVCLCGFSLLSGLLFCSCWLGYLRGVSEVLFCLFLECFLFNRGDPPTFFNCLLFLCSESVWFTPEIFCKQGVL